MVICAMNFREVSSVSVVFSECGPRVYIDQIWWAFSNHVLDIRGCCQLMCGEVGNKGHSPDVEVE